MKYTYLYGNICTCLVDRPNMISKFFATSNTIDTHNQMCQFNLALEKKWLAKKSFTMNSLGSHTYTVDIEENEKAYVRFKSKLYLGRPVVFRISNDSMDVFHG